MKLYSRYLKAAAGGEADVEAADQGVARLSSSLTAEMQAAEKAAHAEARRPSISKINQELVPHDSGAQRAFPGSAQPHRRAHLSDRDLPQRKQQELAAQTDRGAEAARSHDVALPGESAEKRTMDFETMMDQTSGLEGREGEAPARARGSDEAGHRAAHQARSSISRTASPTPARDTSPAVQKLAGQIRYQASARSTSRMSIWWTAANPATWARASR